MTPYDELRRELNATAVISQGFKDRISGLTQKAMEVAYQHGYTAGQNAPKQQDFDLEKDQT